MILAQRPAGRVVLIWQIVQIATPSCPIWIPCPLSFSGSERTDCVGENTAATPDPVRSQSSVADLFTQLKKGSIVYPFRYKRSSFTVSHCRWQTTGQSLRSRPLLVHPARRSRLAGAECMRCQALRCPKAVFLQRGRSLFRHIRPRRLSSCPIKRSRRSTATVLAIIGKPPSRLRGTR